MIYNLITNIGKPAILADSLAVVDAIEAEVRKNGDICPVWFLGAPAAGVAIDLGESICNEFDCVETFYIDETRNDPDRGNLSLQLVFKETPDDKI